jgi:anti-sigma factor RsiW
MRLTSRGIDEYTLAAYLAGKLEPPRRREVADFLARNEDARDLLYAANQLLEGEGGGRAAPRPSLTSVKLPARRRPILTASKRLSVLLWTTITLVCLTAFTTTVFVAFRFGVDSGLSSGAMAQVDPSRMVAVNGPFEALTWPGDPAASSYHVVVFDDETARVVGSVESDIPHMDFEALAAFLPENAPRRIWIDAYDTRGQLLQRSRSTIVRH